MSDSGRRRLWAVRNQCRRRCEQALQRTLNLIRRPDEATRLQGALDQRDGARVIVHVPQSPGDSADAGILLYLVPDLYDDVVLLFQVRQQESRRLFWESRCSSG